MKHYVLVPGYIHSKHDEDRHYITGQMLRRLYQLDPKECSIYRGLRRDKTHILEPGPPRDAELVYLYPSYEGNYGRPQ